MVCVWSVEMVIIGMNTQNYKQKTVSVENKTIGLSTLLQTLKLFSEPVFLATCARVMQEYVADVILSRMEEQQLCRVESTRLPDANCV